MLQTKRFMEKDKNVVVSIVPEVMQAYITGYNRNNDPINTLILNSNPIKVDFFKRTGRTEEASWNQEENSESRA